MTHLERLIKISEISVPHIVTAQVLDRNTPHYGGVIESIKGFPDPMVTRGYLAELLCLYYCSDSVYYHNDEILKRCVAMADHMLHWQHDDGTIDFLEVDWYSVPTVAFSVQVLVPLVRVIDKHGTGSALEEELRDKLMVFLRLAADGMPRGGFNTPNHRWVVASAESLCWNLLGHKECLEDCKLYLQEGIDCDEDGEFTERSVGIYDAVNDNALITMANELDRPDLLDPVRRNLDKLRMYVEPDNTVMTLNSKRQDVGRAVYPINMYWAYRYMAVHDQNPQYAAMAEKILTIWEGLKTPLATARRKYEAVGLTGVLRHFLLDKSLNIDPPASPWNNTFHYFFKNSGIVRERQGDCSFTLLKDNPIFLKVQTGSLSVFAKLHASFTGYGEGRFIADTMQKIDEDIYHMTHKATMFYNRPLVSPGTWDYTKMPNHERKKVGLKELHFNLWVKFEQRAIELQIQLDGVEFVPWKLELLFDANGVWETGDTWLQGAPGIWTILKDGNAVYEKDGDRIKICGGIGQQRYAPYARTSEYPDTEKFNVYLSGFSPVRHTVRIECL
jgi:hypothetical protein